MLKNIWILKSRQKLLFSILQILKFQSHTVQKKLLTANGTFRHHPTHLSTHYSLVTIQVKFVKIAYYIRCSDANIWLFLLTICCQYYRGFAKTPVILTISSCCLNAVILQDALGSHIQNWQVYS